MPTRDRIATPFHWLWPWWTDSYPSPENARLGNASSASFVSWRHNTSGCAYTSHSSTRSWRAFSELTFQVAIRTGQTLPPRCGRSMLFDAVELAQVNEGFAVDLIGRRHRNSHVGAGLEAGGADPTLEHRALAEDHAGAHLGDELAVDSDREHPVEQEVEAVARVALRAQELATLQFADLGPLAGRHDRHRELALECGLHRGDQCSRVALAPGRVLPERVPVPLLEVGQADLGRDLAVTVVDPVAGELAGAEDFEARGAVGPDGQREGGPDGGGPELHERRVLHPAGRREAGAATGGLHEAHLGLVDLWLLAQVGKGDRLEGGMELCQPHRGGAHQPAAAIPGVEDTAAVDLHPGGEVVGEPERTGGPHRLEVDDGVGRRIVVAREPGVEGALHHRTRHGLRRNPRHRRDRSLDPHARTSALSGVRAFGFPNRRTHSRGRVRLASRAGEGAGLTGGGGLHHSDRVA